MNDAHVKESTRHFGVAEDHSDIYREIHELHKEWRGEFEDMRALMWECQTLFFSPSQQAQS